MAEVHEDPAAAEVDEDPAATTRARAPTRRSRRIVESVPTTMISADGTLTKIPHRPFDSAVSHSNSPDNIEAEVNEDPAATTRAAAPTRRSRRIVESVPTTKIPRRPFDSAVSHSNSPHNIEAEVNEDPAATTRATAPTRRSQCIVESVPATMISADGTLTKIPRRPFDSAVSHSNSPHNIEIPKKVQEEIKIINNRLFDTFLEISTTGTGEAPASSQTDIRLSCTYKAMGVSADWGDMKPKPYTVFLIVPPAFPEHSPEICFVESINEAEAENPWYEGVREKFMQCILDMPTPTSLSEIATTWDKCARSALNKYAIQHGGGNFFRAVDIRETTDL